MPLMIISHPVKFLHASVYPFMYTYLRTYYIYGHDIMARMVLILLLHYKAVNISSIDGTVQVENLFGFSLAGYFQLAHVPFWRRINGLKWRLIFPGERENIRQS